MKAGTPHPFVAWCLDVWLMVSIVPAVAEVLAGDVTGTARVFRAFCEVLLIWGLPTIYHAAWSTSAPFVTFGESVLGRVFVDGRKVWGNPYGTSRTLLYGCAAYGMFVRWTVFYDGRIGNTPDLAVQALLIAIAVISMMLLGRGHSWALLGIVVYRALERTAYMRPGQLDSLDDLPWLGIVHSETILFAIVCACVAYGYAASRARMITTASAA